MPETTQLPYNLFFLQFNNYYNRKVRKFDSLSDYASFVLGPETGVNRNFNPNDGIDAEATVNWAYKIPDYCIVTNTQGTILSRWFVIEAKRLRNGQYRMALHRDLFVDFYEEIINAPVFVEKATLQADNPLIFNNEQMTYNQIKRSEDLLKDESGIAWIVGYMASNAYSDAAKTIQTYVPGVPDITVAGISNYAYYNKTYNCYSKLNLMLNFFAGLTPNTLLAYKYMLDLFNYDNVSLDKNSTTDYGLRLSGAQGLAEVAIRKSLRKNGYNIRNQFTTLIGNFSTNETGILNQNGKLIYDSVSQKYYKVKVNYTFTSNTNKISAVDYNNTWGTIKTFFTDTIDNHTVSEYFSQVSPATINNAFIFDYAYKTYTVTVEEVSNLNANRSVTIPKADSRTHLVDAPYDMFCIPYGSISVNEGLNTSINSTIKEDGMAIAMEIAKDAGGNLYDLQLLPYCPIRDIITTTSGGQLWLQVNARNHAFITDANNNKTNVVIFCDKSQFTFNITKDLQIERPYVVDNVTYSSNKTTTNNDYTPSLTVDWGADAVITIPLDQIGLSNVTVTGININSINIPGGVGDNYFIQNGDNLIIHIQADEGDPFQLEFSITIAYNYVDNGVIYEHTLAQDTKVEAEQSMYRLTSPNYASSFDFNVAKNGGVDYINVDCNYKPYTPYIHLNPNFKNMYGNDYDDPRGLICGGDFSLPSVEDKWQTYQIQNKNYQLAFDRNIESMDLKHSIESKMDILNAVTGTITGAMTGAAGGALAGGPVGAIAGGVTGAAASAIGGIMDVNINKMLRTDARDLAIDQFNYSLGNIQALPYTLTKVSAFNKNNKIFPILEHYTATDVEKEALYNKIRWNGMTVMTIGKISDYLIPGEEQYIKGRLIRIEGIDDDFHTANAIADELNQGGYF